MGPKFFIFSLQDNKKKSIVIGDDLVIWDFTKTISWLGVKDGNSYKNYFDPKIHSLEIPTGWFKELPLLNGGEKKFFCKEYEEYLVTVRMNQLINVD